MKNRTNTIERTHITCRKCNETKPVESFYEVNGAGSNNRRHVCIDCMLKYSRLRRISK